MEQQQQNKNQQNYQQRRNKNDNSLNTGHTLIPKTNWRTLPPQDGKHKWLLVPNNKWKKDKKYNKKIK